MQKYFSDENQILKEGYAASRYFGTSRCVGKSRAY
jgi:hypothetical protein